MVRKEERNWPERPVKNLKKQKKKVEGAENIDHIRRVIVLGGIALAGLTAAGVLVPILSRKSSQPEENTTFWNRKPEYESFRGMKESQIHEQIARNHVCFGAEEILSPAHPDYLRQRQRIQATANEVLRDALARGMLNPSKTYLHILATQILGAREEIRFAKPFLDYANLSTDILHRTIKDEDKHRIEWVILKDREDIKKGVLNKGFVVHSFFDVYNLYLIKKEGKTSKKEIAVPFSHREVTGGRFVPVHNEKNQYSGYYCMIGTGPTSIISPISESVAAIYYSEFEKYLTKHGYEKAAIIMEGLTETISNLVHKEAAEKFGIPNGAKLVDAETNNLVTRTRKLAIGLPNRYDAVPAFMKFVKKHPRDGLHRLHGTAKDDFEKLEKLVEPYA